MPAFCLTGIPLSQGRAQISKSWKRSVLLKAQQPRCNILSFSSSSHSVSLGFVDFPFCQDPVDVVYRLGPPPWKLLSLESPKEVCKASPKQQVKHQRCQAGTRDHRRRLQFACEQLVPCLFHRTILEISCRMPRRNRLLTPMVSIFGPQ